MDPPLRWCISVWTQSWAGGKIRRIPAKIFGNIGRQKDGKDGRGEATVNWGAKHGRHRKTVRDGTPKQIVKIFGKIIKKRN